MYMCPGSYITICVPLSDDFLMFSKCPLVCIMLKTKVASYMKLCRKFSGNIELHYVYTYNTVVVVLSLLASQLVAKVNSPTLIHARQLQQ